MSRNESSQSIYTVESIETTRPINEVFKHLFQTKEWSDLTITLGSKSFAVHRCIICPAMPYFNTMMSSEFKESRQDHVTLNPPITIEALECLITWAYSIKIDINLTNVRCLLVASDYLQVNQVFETCCKYLDDVLNIETALQIKEIIRDLEVGNLSSKVQALIINHFTIISKTDKWFELPIELLTKYLEDDNAISLHETEIGDAILRWVEFKPDSRQEHLASLLKLVKWKFVDYTTMIEKIASHELVKNDEFCRKLLHEVFEFVAFQTTESSLSSYWESPRVHKYNGEVMTTFVKSPDKLKYIDQPPYPNPKTEDHEELDSIRRYLPEHPCPETLRNQCTYRRPNSNRRAKKKNHKVTNWRSNVESVDRDHEEPDYVDNVLYGDWY